MKLSLHARRLVCSTRFVALVSTTIMMAASASCTDAGGSASGGDVLYEAGVQGQPMMAADPDVGLGTGTTFTDLYNDYFGPKTMGDGGVTLTGRASCSGNGNCHGDATQPGALDIGYICPNDVTMKHTCYQTMTTKILKCGMPFNQSFMYNVIRKATHAPGDENYMPKTPYTYTFSDASVARIDAWVSAGCPEN